MNCVEYSGESRGSRTEKIMAQQEKKSIPTYSLGDDVRILNSGHQRGRIVELRGPLGPRGIQIYRVRVDKEETLGVKSKPVYIELREDQLRPLNGRKTAAKS
jgi:hypothetical protein